MLRSRLLVVALLLAAPALHACVLHLRSSGPTSIVWDAVDGVDTYEVQESFDQFRTSTNYFIKTNSFAITRRASSNTTATYMVTAMLSSKIASIGPAVDTCSEQLTVTIPGDAHFRALTAKAILPVTGSVAGAFGSRFKTSLTLTANMAGQRGRIVFHPANGAASANDPSIAYSFDNGDQSISWDDIVAQLGASGVGSLDIVPDPDASHAVPDIAARLYNDTPSGTFGTAAEAIYPFDFLQAPTMTVTLPAGPFRMNLGVRTLTATTAKVLIYGVDGRLRTFADLAWPADYTAFGTAAQIVGTRVDPGEKLILYFDGSAIPFYTVTENRTNDPDLFVARPEHSTDVDSYVE